MSSDASAIPVERSLRVPWWLYVVLLGLISAKSIEVVVTLSNLAALANLPLPFSVLVRLIFAGGWLVVMFIFLVLLFRQSPWAIRWIIPVISLYALTHLIWQVLLFRSDFDRGRLGFQILINGMLILPLWTIAWRRGWLKHSATA